MSDVTLESLKTALDSGFENVGVRCTDLATAINVQGEKLDKVREVQVAQEERWKGHFQTHKAIDGRLEGIEKREREEVTARFDIPRNKPKDSDPPKRNGRWTADRVKAWLMVGFLVGIGILTAVNTWSTPSKEDVEVAAERADSVAAAAESSLKENARAREELKKVLQALAPLAEMLETEVTP